MSNRDDTIERVRRATVERFRAIERFARLLGVGAEIHEVRVLTDARKFSGFFNDTSALLRAIGPHRTTGHCYVTLNAVDDALLARAPNKLIASRTGLSAKATDVTRQRWLFIDIDPIRANERAGCCSTQGELRSALALRDRIERDLHEAVEVKPIRIMSGNGGALLYPLAPFDGGEKRVRRLLAALAERFDSTTAHIDRQVFDRVRLTRIPGTLNVKDEVEGRPRRFARLDSAPDSQGECAIEAVEQWLGLARWGVADSEEEIATTLTAAEKDLLVETWSSAGEQGQRHALALALAGVLRKAGWAEHDSAALLVDVCDLAEDEEQADRVRVVADTYRKHAAEVSGWPALESLGIKPSELPSLRTEPSASSGRDSIAAMLLGLVDESWLLVDDRGCVRARIPVDGHHVLHKVEGRPFKSWLTAAAYRALNRVPGSEALQSAINVLVAKVHDAPRVELWNRCAYTGDGCFWLDMADPAWRAIRIDSEGWRVVDDPPPLFRRYTHQRPLPEPLRGGDFKELLSFVNLSSDQEAMLFLVSTIAAVLPHVPQPILILTGPQGSAKTTIARLRRDLIDPSYAPTTPLRRNLGEITQVLDHHYMPIFDNLSRVSEDQSDLLCTAATGGATSKRMLYSDDDDVFASFLRPIVLTGINLPASAPDLLDRALLIEPRRIQPAARREDAELKAAFEAVRPCLVGAMLDALSKAIGLHPSIELPSLPRMADFARWGTAIALALGFQQKEFLDAIRTNNDKQAQQAIDEDPLATALRNFAQKHKNWTGTPTSLLNGLERGADLSDDRWPIRSADLGRRLTALVTPLAQVGVHVTSKRGPAPDRTRTVQIIYRR